MSKMPWVLSDDDIGLLAITAAEGGTGYWGRIASYDPGRWADLDGDFTTGLPADGGPFYRMAEYSDELDDYDWANGFDVTPALIKRGWRKLLKLYPDASGIERDEPGASDSNAADMVIQLGAFGELVYG